MEQDKKQQNVLSLRDLPVHSDSPFMSKLMNVEIKKNFKCVTGPLSDIRAIDNNTGELISEPLHGSRSVQEYEKRADFVMIYLAEIGLLNKLSKASFKVFEYITTILEKHKDEIYFYKEDCLEYCGYAKNSYRSIDKAILELVNYNIIAKSVKPNIFYINPSILFKGKRLYIIKEYILKEKKKIMLEKKEVKLVEDEWDPVDDRPYDQAEDEFFKDGSHE